MSTTRTANLLGEAVTYEVRRSEEASQARIDVGLDGTTLVIPAEREVDPDDIMVEKADWVLKQRDKYARYRAQMPERRFEEGETFPVLGTEREVVVENVLFSLVDGDHIYLESSAVEKTSIKDELKCLYREEARRHFTERAEHFAEVLGVTYKQIQIRNQKTRWGSYSTKTRTLSLNFRLLMAPPDVIDYVIVHELAHAEHPNHGSRFWRLVEQGGGQARGRSRSRSRPAGP
jgi:predicted metal-dependent hydrolase